MGATKSMKVVYKPYLVRQMMNEIHKAQAQDIQIEKFVLTEAEMYQLQSEVGGVMVGFKENTFHGIKVEVR